MDEPSIRRLYEHLQIEANPKKRKGYVTANCPFAPVTHTYGFDSDFGFAVSIKPNQKSRFNCFFCGKNGDMGALYWRLMEQDQIHPIPADWQAAYQLIESELDVYSVGIDYDPEGGPKVPDFAPLYRASMMPLQGNQAAIKYLQDRRVTGAQARDHGLRFDPRWNGVSLPVFDMQRRMTNLASRLIMPRGDLRYYYHQLDGFDHWGDTLYNEHRVDFDEPLVVTESFFDLFMIEQVYPNVVAPLRTQLTQRQLQKLQMPPVLFTMFDRGQGGEKARGQVEGFLRSRELHTRVRHILPPKSDAGECTPLEIEAVFDQHL